MSTSRVHPLYRLASAPLCEASSELLAELALIVWFADDAVESIQYILSNDMAGCTGLMRRRALYLVDRLRRFPCITNEKATLLKALVTSNDFLKPAFFTKKADRLLSGSRLERLAYDWGLEDDVGRQMKDVLELQTRHYVQALGVKNGYADD